MFEVSLLHRNILAFLIYCNFIFNDLGWTVTWSNCNQIIWGNGKRELYELWDDGNTSDGDGWSSTWSLQTGWTCSGGNLSTKDTWSEICGDGKRFNSISTYCDDGNTSSNDGCSSTWNVETGWTCSGGNSSTKDSCSEVWRDGKRFNYVSTYWNDGNTLDGDGWSSSNSTETGWTCYRGISSKIDPWTEIWGDGKRFNTNATYCDDGNTLNGDGWKSSWNVEDRWTCSGGNSSTEDSWTEI